MLQRGLTFFHRKIFQSLYEVHLFCCHLFWDFRATMSTLGHFNSTGLFIVLEGVDRSGKSTQVKLLEEKLEKIHGQAPLRLSFPDRTTTIGKFLDSYLKGSAQKKLELHASHLLFTANRWELQEKLRSARMAGQCVVSDRYSYSGIAYTAAHPPPAPDFEWCCTMERDLIRPDLVICLVPDNPQDLAGRDGYGEERYENVDFQGRLLDTYQRLHDKYQSGSDTKEAANSFDKFWHFVSANQPIEKVHECIMSIVNYRLEEKKRIHVDEN